MPGATTIGHLFKAKAMPDETPAPAERLDAYLAAHEQTPDGQAHQRRLARIEADRERMRRHVPPSATQERLIGAGMLIAGAGFVWLMGKLRGAW